MAVSPGIVMSPTVNEDFNILACPKAVGYSRRVSLMTYKLQLLNDQYLMNNRMRASNTTKSTG